uniref:Secreted protein n=1 Tax=Parastrongyloides trichosuri TaxID=131310 RepID=A0A0N4Z841_PARTI
MNKLYIKLYIIVLILNCFGALIQSQEQYGNVDIFKIGHYNEIMNPDEHIISKRSRWTRFKNRVKKFAKKVGDAAKVVGPLIIRG